MKAVRGLSGMVAGGLFVLALIVVGTAFIAARRGFPGPGTESVTWHIVAAAVGVGAQIFADRRRGSAAASGSLVVLVTAALLLWTQWWG